MKLEKAIELLGYRHALNFSISEAEFLEAERLGIEALNTVKKWREQHRDLGFLLLPGETED